MSGIGPRQLRTIERWTLIVAAVVVAAATLTLPRATAVACAVGAGLECANAWALRVMTERAMKSRGGATPGLGLLLFNVKMVILMAMVAVALFVLRLDGVGFLLGISVFPVALVAAALSLRLEPGSDPDNHPAGPGAPATPGDR